MLLVRNRYGPAEGSLDCLHLERRQMDYVMPLGKDPHRLRWQVCAASERSPWLLIDENFLYKPPAVSPWVSKLLAWTGLLRQKSVRNVRVMAAATERRLAAIPGAEFARMPEGAFSPEGRVMLMDLSDTPPLPRRHPRSARPPRLVAHDSRRFGRCHGHCQHPTHAIGLLDLDPAQVNAVDFDGMGCVQKCNTSAAEPAAR